MVSPAYCDDGNPCTIDSIDGGGCRFDAVADDTICEDGDLCTLGDRCRSGQCLSGDRADGELSVLGQLDSLVGKHAPIGHGRFVTVSRDDLFRARVQLVSRTASGLATISSWAGDLTLAVLGIDEILAHAFEDTGAVAVAAAGDRNVRLFTAGETEVVPRGEIEVSGQIVAMAGHGARLWLCTRDFFTGYRVTLVDLRDPDLPGEIGGISLGGHACGSLAISEDGHRIYMETSDGVRFVDAAPLDTGGDPALSDVIAPRSGISISGSYLILMTSAGVRILREADHQEVITVPVTRARAATLIGDRLLIEGNRASGGDTEVFVAWYDALGAGGPTLLDEVLLSTYIGAPQTSSFRTATDGATAIIGTRLFDLTHDRLDEVRVPQLIPLRSLARAGNGVRAYVASGASGIDATDAGHPVFAAGGAFGAPSSILNIAIDDSLALPSLVSGLGQGLEDPTRVPLDTSNPYFASPLLVHRWVFDEHAGVVSNDWFALPHQGRSQLLTAGDFMYRLRLPSPSRPGVQLQGYWLPAMTGGVQAVPAFDLAVPAGTTGRRGFDVDPTSRVAVVSTEAPGSSGDLEPALMFYDLSRSPPAVIDTVPADAVYSQLRVSGDRVVAVSSNGIVFYQRGKGEVSRLQTDAFEEQLLAFDGQVAYVGQLHIIPGASTYELAAATFGGGAPPVLVEVNGVATSLVALDHGLAVGFDAQLVTVHPHCARAPSTLHRAGQLSRHGAHHGSLTPPSRL